MEKGIIIYQSKYGATKKYVDWLVDTTKFDFVETSKAKIASIEQYEKIILCGGIYASGIAGLQFLKKNYNKLKNKKIAIFCVGASPYDEKAFEEIKKHNLKDDLKDISEKNKREIYERLNHLGISEFGIAKVETELKHNEKSLSLAPQVGDGEVTRYYLIGKKANTYKIFEVYWEEFLND